MVVLFPLFLVIIAPLLEFLKRCRSNKSHQDNQKWWVRCSLQILCRLFVTLFPLKREKRTKCLGLTRQVRCQKYWVEYSAPRHQTWDYGVTDGRSHHLPISFFLACGVFIGSHDEACLLVVVFVLVEDAVKVGKLPAEDVS